MEPLDDLTDAHIHHPGDGDGGDFHRDMGGTLDERGQPSDDGNRGEYDRLDKWRDVCGWDWIHAGCGNFAWVVPERNHELAK
jgi:hypothetical protein